jgi:hypothetical protein
MNPDYPIDRAAYYGRIVVLKSFGCEWDDDAEHIPTYAAYNGHLKCLKYLHENGCPWNKEATEVAAENGHLECLKYLHKNGCPIKKQPIKTGLTIKCLKYLHDNGFSLKGVDIEEKVQVCWEMIREIVRARAIVVFWLNKTTVKSYSKDGPGRKRDRQEFVQEFEEYLH